MAFYKWIRNGHQDSHAVTVPFGMPDSHGDMRLHDILLDYHKARPYPSDPSSNAERRGPSILSKCRQYPEKPLYPLEVPVPIPKQMDPTEPHRPAAS
jgi:hypothetical protein